MELLHIARKVVAYCGPAPQASDVGDLALAFAQANAEVLTNRWCSCGTQSNEVYFRRTTGSHGWMCPICCGLTQTG